MYAVPTVNSHHSIQGGGINYLSKETQRFVPVRINDSTSPQVNSPEQRVPDICGARYPATLLVRHIILHPRACIDL